jgi:hypothetical protein
VVGRPDQAGLAAVRDVSALPLVEAGAGPAGDRPVVFVRVASDQEVFGPGDAVRVASLASAHRIPVRRVAPLVVAA